VGALPFRITLCDVRPRHPDTDHSAGRADHRRVHRAAV